MLKRVKDCEVVVISRVNCKMQKYFSLNYVEHVNWLPQISNGMLFIHTIF